MDNLNNQGSQGQNPDSYQGQPMDQPNNDTNYNQESNSTYWESGNANYNQTAYDNSQSAGTDNDQSIYQQPVDMAPYGYQPQQAFTTPPKKKSRMKLVVALLIVVVILGGAATAYAFSDKLQNTVAMMLKSPKDYYASIEKDYIEKGTNKLTEQSGALTDKKDVAIDISADLTYDKDTVNSLLAQSGMGISIEDIEQEIGIPLNSIGFDVIAASSKDKAYGKVGFGLNNVDLITAEVLVDILEEELLVRIPELSDAFIRQTLDLEELGANFDLDSIGVDYTKFETVKPEDVIALVQRYMNIVVDNVSNVELEKNQKVELGDITFECNIITVKLTNKDAVNIAKAVLAKAKDDAFIISLLPSLGLSKEDYQKAIDEALGQLNLEFVAGDDSILEMYVYVDKLGNIIGREVTILDEKETIGSFGYYCVNDKEEDKFQFYISDEDDNTILDVNGTSAKKGDLTSGEIGIDIYTPYDESFYNFEVKFQDVKSETKNGRLFQYGKYTLSAPLMFPGAVEISFDVDGNAQKSNLSVIMGTSKLVSLDVSTEILEGFDIPSVGSATIYDSDNIEEYAMTLDIYGFIEDISNKLGVDLSELMDELSYMFY